MKVPDNKLHASNWSLTCLTEQNRITGGGGGGGGSGGGDSFVKVLDNSSKVKDTAFEGYVIMALVMVMILFSVAVHYATQFTLIA